MLFKCFEWLPVDSRDVGPTSFLSAEMGKRPFWRSGRRVGPPLSGVEDWAVPGINSSGMRRFGCCRSRDVFRIDACEGMAKAILGPTEFEIWSELRTPGRRRRQWLLGRLCAKKAVCRIVRPPRDPGWRFSDIEILPDNYGRPVVWPPSDYRPNGFLSVSIAHSEHIVAAIAGVDDGCLALGIDVEPIYRDYKLLESGALRPSERLLLCEQGRETRSEWVVRLWCAKEALAKAIGLGMIGGPLSFVVDDLEAISGRVMLSLEGKPLKRRQELRGRSFCVLTGRDKEIVYASAVLD